ncbi:mCG49770, partial [Mus musculus]
MVESIRRGTLQRKLVYWSLALKSSSHREDPALLLPRGVLNVASVCLQIRYPSVASGLHSIINGYEQITALSVETEYTFPLAEKVKAFMANPSTLVAAAPVGKPRLLCSPAKAEAKKELEESDEDIGFSLLEYSPQSCQ